MILLYVDSVDWKYTPKLPAHLKLSHLVIKYQIFQNSNLIFSGGETRGRMNYSGTCKLEFQEI